jgi:hypothetical protein
MVKHCSMSQSGTGSRTTTNVAARHAAQHVASRSWMGLLGFRPEARWRNRSHHASWSSIGFASFKSSVSKPSVNQL